ncbi:YegS/Rv2252/BmrU family lipid kinase [Lactobacillus sp. ESL0684]|uniref:diacylglycerol/lipid kinase family protein n=1 Tax=Lactobacillus sp. ESL0684 TaxID=2983213 RepID=UPI0023F63FB5|nr:YegS/Rv2252/BmrU family lipid kinase [Lactobacillus sp. ESL0684]WEV42875.1 YegS/Rv2252/BmrU family lipid kinase [Lactobacillus sp. ESL0684]
MKIHLLVNESAGNGHAKKIFDQTVLLLIDQDIAFSFEKSNYAGELITLAEAYGNLTHSDNEYLIVIGGDGSLNEVLNGIKRSSQPNLPFAYLPAGTGNDFGRAANLTNQPKTLLKQLKKRPTPTLMDCGAFKIINRSQQTYYFANNLGIGFDAYVNHYSNHSNLKKLLNTLKQGKLSYISYILKAVSKQDTFQVDVQSKSHKLHFNDAFLVTTTNHPYLGGGIPLLPSASVTNHQIATVIVEKRSIPKLIKLFINLLKDGSHIKDPQFHYLEAKKITIKTYQPEFGQVDGEEIHPRAFELELTVNHFNLLK